MKKVRNEDAAWHAENDAEQHSKIVAIATSKRKTGYFQMKYDTMYKWYNVCRSTSVLGGHKFFSLYEL